MIPTNPLQTFSQMSCSVTHIFGEASVVSQTWSWIRGEQSIADIANKRLKPSHWDSFLIQEELSRMSHTHALWPLIENLVDIGFGVVKSRLELTNLPTYFSDKPDKWKKILIDFSREVTDKMDENPSSKEYVRDLLALVITNIGHEVLLESEKVNFDTTEDFFSCVLEKCIHKLIEEPLEEMREGDLNPTEIENLAHSSAKWILSMALNQNESFSFINRLGKTFGKWWIEKKLTTFFSEIYQFECDCCSRAEEFKREKKGKQLKKEIDLLKNGVFYAVHTTAENLSNFIEGGLKKYCSRKPPILRLDVRMLLENAFPPILLEVYQKQEYLVEMIVWDLLGSFLDCTNKTLTANESMKQRANWLIGIIKEQTNSLREDALRLTDSYERCLHDPYHSVQFLQEVVIKLFELRRQHLNFFMRRDWQRIAKKKYSLPTRFSEIGDHLYLEEGSTYPPMGQIRTTLDVFHSKSCVTDVFEFSTRYFVQDLRKLVQYERESRSISSLIDHLATEIVEKDELLTFLTPQFREEISWIEQIKTIVVESEGELTRSQLDQLKELSFTMLHTPTLKLSVNEVVHSSAPHYSPFIEQVFHSIVSLAFKKVGTEWSKIDFNYQNRTNRVRERGWNAIRSLPENDQEMLKSFVHDRVDEIYSLVHQKLTDHPLIMGLLSALIEEENINHHIKEGCLILTGFFLESVEGDAIEAKAKNYIFHSLQIIEDKLNEYQNFKNEPDEIQGLIVRDLCEQNPALVSKRDPVQNNEVIFIHYLIQSSSEVILYPLVNDQAFENLLPEVFQKNRIRDKCFGLLIEMGLKPVFHNDNPFFRELLIQIYSQELFVAPFDPDFVEIRDSMFNLLQDIAQDICEQSGKNHVLSSIDQFLQMVLRSCCLYGSKSFSKFIQQPNATNHFGKTIHDFLEHILEILYKKIPYFFKESAFILKLIYITVKEIHAYVSGKVDFSSSDNKFYQTQSVFSEKISNRILFSLFPEGKQGLPFSEESVKDKIWEQMEKKIPVEIEKGLSHIESEKFRLRLLANWVLKQKAKIGNKGEVDSDLTSLTEKELEEVIQKGVKDTIFLFIKKNTPDSFKDPMFLFLFSPIIWILQYYLTQKIQQIVSIFLQINGKDDFPLFIRKYLYEIAILINKKQYDSIDVGKNGENIKDFLVHILYHFDLFPRFFVKLGISFVDLSKWTAQGRTPYSLLEEQLKQYKK